MADSMVSDLFTSLFGKPTQGLSLFTDNAFRRPKSTNPDLGHSASKLHSSTIAPATTPKHGVSVGGPRADREEEMKPKKKKRDFPEPVSDDLGACRGQESIPFSGKKRNRSDESFAAEKSPSKKAARTSKIEQILSAGKVETIAKPANAETHVKPIKRSLGNVPDKEKPMKRQKLGDVNRPNAVISTKVGERDESVSQKEKTSTKRKKDDCSPNLKSEKKQSKTEVSLEARYEKKLRGIDNNLTKNKDSGPLSILQEDEKDKVAGGSIGKRKRSEGDEPFAKVTRKKIFDTEEKLKRTIFVGNLPLAVKKKALIKEFSIYGSVESVRLRSVPLLDTKIPRRGAIIKGQVNETINSQHAYVVFSTIAHANAALAHNMKELCGNHLRVDAAYAPHQSVKGKLSLHYDPKRSIFVGNIPFDVKDEELYQVFGTGKSPELGIEAVRVVRDPQTSVSKGIAYVLFKSKAGALFFLSRRRNIKLRERVLRIHRVLASQSMHKVRSPTRHTKRIADVGDSLPQRKRAKLSASYEGIRASKENPHLGKDKQKLSVNQQHMNRSPRVKGHGAAKAVGTKRKRMEKHQRGISRSKKIRRK